MTIQRALPLALVTMIACVTAGGALASSAPGDEAAIRAVMVRDMTIAVAPWIPCTHGRAAALSPGAVRARQALVDAMMSQTYTTTEPTHAKIRAHLRALIAAYGVGGPAARAGETLCDVGGGVDRVQVSGVTIACGRARMTIQAHEWNETIGRHGGVAFHYRPQAVIAQTDEAILQHGHWLISRRGPVTFVSGAP